SICLLITLLSTLSCSRHPRHLHSFPTRRSSDLPDQLREDQAAEPRAALAALDVDGVLDGPRERGLGPVGRERAEGQHLFAPRGQDRKSTRLNSSHVSISYAVFCLKKKKKKKKNQ